MVRKKHAPECVGTLRGPQTSRCNKLKIALIDMELEENKNPISLTMRQIL